MLSMQTVIMGKGIKFVHGPQSRGQIVLKGIQDTWG
jgi:hypothetical protein